MKKITCIILVFISILSAQIIKAPSDYIVISREAHDGKYCLYVLDKKDKNIYAIYDFDVLLVKHDYNVKQGEILGVGSNITIESVDGI